MDYTLPQVTGYLQAHVRLEKEAIVNQSLAVAAANLDPKDWDAWAQKLIR